MSKSSPAESIIDKPPLFKTWRGMYWLVVASLVIQIIVFYFLTQYYK
ncbi:hypothetical protein [Adhaeribacter pallidiroseus]|nr:hypothetical protein [Adhaeribacter pallidiroseus]